MSPNATITLPLARRLRRAFLIALLLGLWAPFKIAWEQHIAEQQDQLRYRGVQMTRQLRDEISQGVAIGVLSGMRSVVADFIWLQVTVAWMNEEWFRMGGYINLCTALQPRAPVFWDIGGWQLAWNASIAAAQDKSDPNELRRLKAARFWLEKGTEIYLRGIENNPENWELSAHTGLLYDQRYKNYPMAAYYYDQASKLPSAPPYLERFPAIMYDDKHAGNPEISYAYWKALWERLTPAERLDPRHFAGKSNAPAIHRYEDKLSIPKEKRIFPN